MKTSKTIIKLRRARDRQKTRLYNANRRGDSKAAKAAKAALNSVCVKLRQENVAQSAIRLKLRQRRCYKKNRARFVAASTARTRRLRKLYPERYRSYASKGRAKHAAANRRRILKWKKENWARQLEINRNCPSYFARLLGAAVGQKLPIQLIQIKQLQVNVTRAINQKNS